MSRAVCFTDPSGARRIGALDGESVRDAGPAGPEGFVPTPEAWRTIAAASGPVYALGDVQLAVPVVPSKLVCIGLNYRDHAEETGAEIPTAPVVFAKFTSSLIGPGETIVVPYDEPRTDYEAELALVIGTRVRRVTGAAALAAIGGITAFNDVSGREAQYGPGGQFTRGKSYDTFAPLGPCIASVDGLDLGDLRVRTTLSGELLQDSSTANLIFGVQTLIEFCSAAFTLEPGDVIATGTPPGVGDARTPPRYLVDGDICEIEVEGVGVLRNPCVAEERPRVTLTLTASVPLADEILTAEALGLIERLQREFGPRRRALLEARDVRQAGFDAGERPAFRAAPEADFRVAPTPPDLERRWVEITGPAEPRMMINAFNSGADCFMVDLEDSLSPTFANVVAAQAALRDAVLHTLAHTTPEGREYRLNETIARLLVRPRGWHLVEAHVLCDGEPVSASFFDIALLAIHSARAQVERGTTPAFYLPKLESADEAALWNDVFVAVQEAVGIPRGTFRATVLIETITASFEMDAILYELREHASGLNAGRWDYIFSVIKKFREDPAFVLPDRVQVTMTVPFMRAYTELLVQTCHKRGAHAIGGMSALIPSRRDPEANEIALAKVGEDKRREAGDGFDGTWIAHPDLVAVARAEFQAVLGDRPHQKERLREDVSVSAEQLLDVAIPGSTISNAGVRANVDVGLRYLQSWLAGHGAAAIHGLMEDAATAEISRAQLWQWRHLGVELSDGGRMDDALYRSLRDELVPALGEGGAQAAELLDELVQSDTFEEFLTLRAYARLG